MSHDEIVGNVLSWLGSWLEDRKQPKPTLLVTHSVCSQPSARRKYSSFLDGKVIWGDPSKDTQIRFLLPCFEREILQFNLPPECQVKRDLEIGLRCRWEDTCHQRGDGWAWSLALAREHERKRRKGFFQEVMSSEVSLTTGHGNQDVQFSASVLKYLINIYLEERLGVAWTSK